jgi:predicted dienelactone hydrolase
MFLGLKGPGSEDFFFKERVEDMTRILDNLDIIEDTVLGLKGRLDRSRVAIAGHSMGAFTASMLLGASNTDPRNGIIWTNAETRIKAGIILAGVGNGGSDMSEQGKLKIPFFGPDFKTMATPALIVYGTDDVNPYLTLRNSDWHVDPYLLAPGSKALLTLKGAKHGLGGISGWDTAETLDEGPELLAVVQRMTWAYLKSQLYEGAESWTEACKALAKLGAIGSVESKV